VYEVLVTEEAVVEAEPAVLLTVYVFAPLTSAQLKVAELVDTETLWLAGADKGTLSTVNVADCRYKPSPYKSAPAIRIIAVVVAVTPSALVSQTKVTVLALAVLIPVTRPAAVLTEPLLAEAEAKVVEAQVVPPFNE
jgi:hypothetical protein